VDLGCPVVLVRDRGLWGWGLARGRGLFCHACKSRSNTLAALGFVVTLALCFGLGRRMVCDAGSWFGDCAPAIGVLVAQWMGVCVATLSLAVVARPLGAFHGERMGDAFADALDEVACVCARAEWTASPADIKGLLAWAVRHRADTISMLALACELYQDSPTVPLPYELATLIDHSIPYQHARAERDTTMTNAVYGT
jgi:hypothetical protein